MLSIMQMLINAAAAPGDVLTDAPEMDGPVAAASNLSVLARRLSDGVRPVVMTGKLLIDGAEFADAEVDITGTVMVDENHVLMASDFESGRWGFRPSGRDEVFHLLFANYRADEGVVGWVVTNADRFYDMVLEDHAPV